MRENEKAHPDAGTSERAEGADFAGHVPKSYNSTSTCEKRDQKCFLIYDLLHVGSENGMTLRELVQLTGEDERTIRNRIHDERRAGKIIISDNKSGYFLPACENDVQRFIKSMSRRSREIAAISQAAEMALSKMSGQVTVDGW